LPHDLEFPGKYQRTLAYFVEGTLNAAAFGSEFESSPTSNIFLIDHEERVASISLLKPVDYDERKDVNIPNVYKIFSREDLSKEDLGKYFSHIESHITVDWLAYPNYQTFPGLGDFEIHKNLFYLNNIEWAASAIEMSAMAGKNIANWISNEIHPGKQNAQSFVKEEGKSEL